MALGGVLPELIYSAIAFGAVELLADNEQLFTYIKLSAVPILIGMGIYMYRQKTQKSEYNEPFSYKGSFFKGFALAMLNPQLITFWFTWILVAYQFIDFHPSSMLSGYLSLLYQPLLKIFPAWLFFSSAQLSFIFGTAAGAYLMLRVFIWLTHKYKQKVIQTIERLNLNKIIGLIFIGIALLLLLNIAYKQWF